MYDAPTSMPLLISRTWWIMFGPLLLLFCVVNIITKGSGWFTTWDFVYGIGLAGIILARWYEFYKGDPRTATGEPATWDHLYRYSLIALGLGIGIWIVANLLGNYFIAR